MRTRSEKTTRQSKVPTKLHKSKTSKKYNKASSSRATSSFSVSLVFEGKLWGLLACHNSKPVYIDQKKRLVCESLGHLYAWQLHTKELHQKKELFQIRQRKLNNIVHQLTSYPNPLEAITQKEKGLLDVADACGMAVTGAVR